MTNRFKYKLQSGFWEQVKKLRNSSYHIKFVNYTPSSLERLVVKFLERTPTVKVDLLTKKQNRYPQKVGVSRSFEDYFLTCLYYFPNATDSEIIEVFNNNAIHYGYCYTHFKFMFTKPLYTVKTPINVEHIFNTIDY